MKEEKEKAVYHDSKEAFPIYLDLSVQDLVMFPEESLHKLLLKLAKADVQCLTCHQKFSFMFLQSWWSQKCGCGIRFFYPPRKDRGYAYGTKFITRTEYEKNKPSRDN